MRDKELIKQLNSFKSISPDASWKSKKRELLLNQLSNSVEPNGFSFSDFVANLKTFSAIGYNYAVKPFTQPVLAVVLITVLVFGGGIASMNAARDSKPGDSLYVAKIIQEKTQIALTFDEKKKAQLNLEFAGNRAKEITRVLETEDSHEEKTERVAKLTKNFEKEIKQVKERLVKIGNKQNEEAGSNETVVETESLDDDDDPKIFSAGLDKKDDGLSISDHETEEKEPAVVPEEKSEDIDETKELVGEERAEATTTLDKIATTTLDVEETIGDIPEVETTEGIINEAKELLENEDIDGTLTKLEEAVENLNINVDEGQVKGVEEEAPIDELIDAANEQATSSEPGA